MNQPGEAPRCSKCGSHRDANVHIHPNMFGYHDYVDSYYQFRKDQEVTVLKNHHGNYVGRKGKIKAKRAGVDGSHPEYLVKLQGKSGPVSFEETELAI